MNDQLSIFKVIAAVIVMLSPTFLFAQKFKSVKSKNERYNKIIKSQVDLNYNYPDGRYKMYDYKSSKSPSFIFHIEGGKINGAFMERKSCGWNVGNYYNDSLWTFLKDPSDTTFKVGTWKVYSCASNEYSLHSYKIPYNEYGRYVEYWEFSNGTLAREAMFEKGSGLTRELFWKYKPNQVWKEIAHAKTRNYSHTIVYENDSIAQVSIKQQGIEIRLDYDAPLENGQPLVEIEIYSDSWNHKELPIASMAIDDFRTVNEYNDFMRQIFLQENRDGNINLDYRMIEGRMKQDIIRIR